MAEKRKKQTNKQVNKNKPNLSTIKNSQKTLGYTFGYSLCFRADNSPALPHPHPQIQIMNRPDKKNTTLNISETDCSPLQYCSDSNFHN